VTALILPDVSVIIPTFNRARKVVRSISSVLDQTFTNYEIIIVDDGSSDGTANSLAQFKHNSKIKCLSHPKNLGVSAARNNGIMASRALLLAFLDSDDYWLPEKLVVQVKFFRQNPKAVVCQTEEVWIRKGQRVNPRKKHRKPSGYIFEPSLKLCLVSPSAVMLKRSLLDKVGFFDENLPVCEDYDLWLRISSQYPIYLIDQNLAVREGGDPDQLSSRYKGMDRFRIKAMMKLIRSGQLDEDQCQVVLQELAIKCRIYGKGCIKRGKNEEGEFYLQLPEKVKKEISGDNRVDWYRS
jgi:glycosyltransferase involved in cell wall biosynthesis